jgi:hypothetical protein
MRTTFVIRFVARVTLGLRNGTRTEYVLDAFEGNRHPTTGCTGSFSDVIKRGQRGHRVAFTEHPGLPPFETGTWCPAGYRAKIRLVRLSFCSSSRLLCRQSVVVGRISWRVKRG